MAAVALITGASGLIGRHVVAQWDLSDLEVVLARHETDDLLSPGVPAALVARVRPLVVVHLAWDASGTPGYRTSPRNGAWVDASLELARACEDAGAWLVATGTPLDTVAEMPDAYAAAKSRLWHMLARRTRAGEMTWIRPYYVVDPDRRRPALVDEALAASERGATLVLRTPESRHDFVHAQDVGRAIVAAVRHGLRGELEVGSGRARSVATLVEALGVAWEPSPDAPGATVLHSSAVADSARLLEVGWSPVRTKELFE